MSIETETIDRLFLELSQFTQAKTSRELWFEAEVQRLLKSINYYELAYTELWEGHRVSSEELIKKARGS